jgi:hypothetical protein
MPKLQLQKDIRESLFYVYDSLSHIGDLEFDCKHSFS